MTTRGHVIVVFHVVLFVTAHSLSYSLFVVHRFMFSTICSRINLCVELEVSIGFGCDHDHALY